MSTAARLADLDALIETQIRLNHQVRQHFGALNMPDRELTPDEAQKARALICDLQFILTELRLRQDITAQAMTDVFHNVNASLAYLKVGRSIKRDRRMGGA